MKNPKNCSKKKSKKINYSRKRLTNPFILSFTVLSIIFNVSFCVSTKSIWFADSANFKENSIVETFGFILSLAFFTLPIWNTFFVHYYYLSGDKLIICRSVFLFFKKQHEIPSNAKVSCIFVKGIVLKMSFEYGGKKVVKRFLYTDAFVDVMCKCFGPAILLKI